jgi:lysozyme family protein
VIGEELGVDAMIDALIDREGGYANHPADKGGPTYFGITEAVARAHGYAGSMRNLPREEAAAIYRRLYWLRPRFDQVAQRSSRIAAELFDTGVRYSGVSLSLQLGTVLGGGVAPFVATALHGVAGASWPVTVYAVVLAVTSLLCVRALHETHRRDLSGPPRG